MSRDTSVKRENACAMSEAGRGVRSPPPVKREGGASAYKQQLVAYSIHLYSRLLRII